MDVAAGLIDPGARRPIRLAGTAKEIQYLGMADIKNPGVAAVCSAILPGLGQFYNGDFLRGVFWLIVTPGLWIGSGGLLGWVCHVIAAVTAHSRAKRKNRQYATV